MWIAILAQHANMRKQNTLEQAKHADTHTPNPFQSNPIEKQPKRMMILKQKHKHAKRNNSWTAWWSESKKPENRVQKLLHKPEIGRGRKREREKCRCDECKHFSNNVNFISHIVCSTIFCMFCIYKLTVPVWQCGSVNGDVDDMLWHFVKFCKIFIVYKCLCLFADVLSVFLTNAGYNAPQTNQQPQRITWVALLASPPSICWFHNFLIPDPKLLSLFFTPPNPKTINIHYTSKHSHTNKYLWCWIFTGPHRSTFCCAFWAPWWKLSHISHITRTHTLAPIHFHTHTYAQHTFIPSTRTFTLTYTLTCTHSLVSSNFSTIKNRHLVGQKNYSYSLASCLFISDVCRSRCNKH